MLVDVDACRCCRGGRCSLSGSSSTKAQAGRVSDHHDAHDRVGPSARTELALQLVDEPLGLREPALLGLVVDLDGHDLVTAPQVLDDLVGDRGVGRCRRGLGPRQGDAAERAGEGAVREGRPARRARESRHHAATLLSPGVTVQQDRPRGAPGRGKIREQQGLARARNGRPARA